MKEAHPSNEEPDSLKPIEELLSDPNSNYRCPVCGDMVDPSQAEQILLHHEHVTHPHDFALARKAVA
jgi:hypothetical protein